MTESPKPQTAHPNGAALAPEGTAGQDEVRLRVSALIRKLGVREAARLLGVHQQTALAIAAGASVRAGSFALARQNLQMSEGPS